jgi:hypothetical protein
VDILMPNAKVNRRRSRRRRAPTLAIASVGVRVERPVRLRIDARRCYI